MRVRFLGVLGAFALAAALGACDSTPPVTPPPGDAGVADQPRTEPSCALALTAVTPQTQNVQVGNTADLAVRVTNCRGEAPDPVLVSFTISGDAQGSTLSVASASSDDGGVARTAITAGQQAASFEVQASQGALAPVVFQVNVTVKPLGGIAVQLSYAGSKTFSGFQALLFANQVCTGFDPFNLPASLQQSTTVASLSDQPQLTNLLEASYAVVVTARKGTELTGWGCTSGVSVVAGKTTNAPVTIVDLPVYYTGVYLLDNQFDLTGALPPSVATTVKLFNEAADDHDLTNEGNGHGNSQYGLDPGAFLLDFVYRQFCRWECTGGQDFDSCSELNHPQGDLSALYLKTFMSWSGAQPTVVGVCGALDFPLGPGSYVYTWVNDKVQTQITTLVPTAAQNLLQMVGDISSAFTNMKVKSRLTLTNVGGHGAPGNFTHVLETMTLTVHDLAGTPMVKQVTLADAGLTNLSYSGSTVTKDDALQIPKHGFQLSFGKLLQYLYLNVILPTLGYTSTSQMFASWVDCSAVGNWLYQQIGAATGLSLLPASAYKGFCDLGLQAAGAFLENAIVSSTSAKTQLELEGSCEAGTPLGPGRVALTLVKGVWSGTITEGTFTAPLSGIFAGVRQ